MLITDKKKNRNTIGGKLKVNVSRTTERDVVRI